jgi:hypothetical protein
METNTEAWVAPEWPLPIFSSDGKNLISLLERPSQEVGGKILVLLGNNSDHCELDKKFKGPNARDLQFKYLLNEAESIEINKWFEHQLANEWWLEPLEEYEFDENDPDARKDHWWVRDNWQEMMPIKIAEYGEPGIKSRDPMGDFLNTTEELNYSIIPVEKAWMIPCYLNCGNWNDVTDAAHMAALFKYWEEKYGAEFCFMARNGNFGFRVARPPQTMEDAMLLAIEHHIFCAYSLYDSNDGVNGMKDMVHFLLGNRGWHFWFD